MLTADLKQRGFPEGDYRKHPFFSMKYEDGVVVGTVAPVVVSGSLDPALVETEPIRPPSLSATAAGDGKNGPHTALNEPRVPSTSLAPASHITPKERIHQGTKHPKDHLSRLLPSLPEGHVEDPGVEGNFVDKVSGTTNAKTATAEPELVSAPKQKTEPNLLPEVDRRPPVQVVRPRRSRRNLATSVDMPPPPAVSPSKRKGDQPSGGVKRLKLRYTPAKDGAIPSEPNAAGSSNPKKQTRSRRYEK